MHPSNQGGRDRSQLDFHAAGGQEREVIAARLFKRGLALQFGAIEFAATGTLGRHGHVQARMIEQR